MIPRIDAQAFLAGNVTLRADVAKAALETGFLTLHNTPISKDRLARVFDAYHRFFALPDAEKQTVDMARTGSNRGWGGAQSEQVNAQAKPDYKQVFDCGFELPKGHSLSHLSVYAPNQWPAAPADFRQEIESYYSDALVFARAILLAVLDSVGADAAHFETAFDVPMALLRGNYYPERPDWAGAQDFGIAEHTDYGCLTLLATDGVPGLEVRARDGQWIAVDAPLGEFVINFGEMLESWTGGKVAATPHRVIGTRQERFSVPLFFNPRYDTNVASLGQPPLLAGDYLARRFGETYLHLKAS